MLSDSSVIAPPPKWTNAQQTFLDLLQDEENQVLSKLDLCRKAGFAFAGPWYTAIKDPRFREAVKALYTEVEPKRCRSGVAASSKAPAWSKAQQTFLDLLQTAENRQLEIAALCEKAGFPNYGYWYRAIEDPRFREALGTLGVEVNRRPSKQANQSSPAGPKWGRIHRRLLAVLQAEENHHLSVVELCQKAGFASKNCWYRALKHPQFKAAVEALGVEIERTGINAKPRAVQSSPQWGNIHQTLLELLQVEANRHLSITALCQKAGFADRTYWYRALKHPQFKAAVEALGIEIERYELSAKGPTKAQRKILQVLQKQANRQLPIVEICRQAGYSDDYWYKALKSQDFVQALDTLGVAAKRREYNDNGWTEVQQNLLDVLQDPANHPLAITEICQKAGYPNCTYWFRALKSQRFIAAVEAIGVEIWWHGRNQNGFTRAQQRFLDALQETPTTTTGELCRRLGYTGTSAWTAVIQDAYFVETLATLGVYVERIPRCTDGWTLAQKRLVEILQVETHRELPIVQVCRLAGFSNQVWYRALQRSIVLSRLKELNVPIRRYGPDEDGWTRAQRRLLDVLRDGKNRKLSLIELCAQAGYSDLSRWYDSLSSTQFVETLQHWGVLIARQKPPYPPHIDVKFTMSLEADLNQDVWDIRQFKADYPKHRSPSTFILDFTSISNLNLRQQVKHYLRQLLPRWRAATFVPQLLALRGVLTHLPPDVDIGTITRAHIEDLLPNFLAESSDSWAKSCLGATKAMFFYMEHSRTWTGPRPPANLIDCEDIPSPKTPLPRPIPLDVLDQLDPLLELAIQAIQHGQDPPILQPIFWDAILILRRTGMRFSDLAHLEAPNERNRGGCLGQDTGGDWWVHLRPEKTKMGREHQIPTIPEDGVVDAILRQSERGRSVPDHFNASYLFRTESGVLTYRAFCKALDKLSGYLVYAGRPYAITPHQFRHTIATDMIDHNVDVLVVRDFLGHVSVMMTLRYIQVYKRGLQAKYQAYRARTSEQRLSTPLPIQLVGSNIISVHPGEITPGWVEGHEGRLYRFDLQSGLGVCEQPPRLQPSCLMGGQCSTTCSKLRSGKQHLSAWENRICRLRTTLEELQAYPGYEWNCQQYERELRQAEKVVATIQQEGFWDGRIHNAAHY